MKEAPRIPWSLDQAELEHGATTPPVDPLTNLQPVTAPRLAAAPPLQCLGTQGRSGEPTKPPAKAGKLRDEATKEGPGARAWRPSATAVAMTIALAAMWSLAALVARPGSATAHFGAVLVLCAAAGVMQCWAIASRRADTKALRGYLADARRTGGAESFQSALDGDLQPAWQVASRHADNVQERLDEMVNEQARLGLELSLSNTQKRLVSAVIDAVGDPILVTDPFDQIVLANPAASELFKFDREKALRRPVDEVIPEPRLVAALRAAREADSRAARRRMECDSGGRAFSVSLAPIVMDARPLAAGGSPYLASGDSPGANLPHGVVALLRDVSKDREAARLKSEFVAHAAHELRTPLSAIRAYVEMLVDGEAADEKTRAEYYEIIEASANRLARMIDNILNISRIEAGTVRVSKQPVAVSLIVKEAADTLRPQADQKGISLTEELAPVVDRILADRDLLQQALLNLISNAIKYTPEGGRVLVRMVTTEQANRGAGEGTPLSAPARTIRIEVADSGAGIPDADLPRMFERFFRVEAHKQLAPGTGLGLSLVKQIVETVHGGEVSVSSEVGKGSTFAMSLPLYAAE